MDLFLGDHRGASNRQLPPEENGRQSLPRVEQLPARKQGAQTTSSPSGNTSQHPELISQCHFGVLKSH